MLKTGKTTDGHCVSELSIGSEKRIEVVCDTCGETTETNVHNYHLGQRKHPGQTFCRRCAVVASALLRRGKHIKSSGPRPQVWADKSPTWKGGKFIASDGYVQVYLGPKRYRKEHFLVMEAALGRSLNKGEVIHHIDGDKQNNSLENLFLHGSEAEHRRAHNSLQDVAFALIKAGVIEFDRDSGTYRVVG